MNLLRSTALAAALPFAMVLPVSAENHVSLDTEDQKLSYALGVLIGSQIAGDFASIDLDFDALSAAMQTMHKGEEPLIAAAEAGPLISAHMQKAQAEASAAKIEAAAAFMAENAAKEDVTVTESGLQYKVLATGEGPMPTVADTVSVHYTGKLLDGTVFDSSVQRGEPAQFPVSGVIAGWTEALQLMQPGTKFQVWIPSDLAYGERGAGGDIGPNETLTFDMELLEIVGN